MLGRSLPGPCRFLRVRPANRRHSQSGGTCNGLRSLSCFCRACITDFAVRGVPYLQYTYALFRPLPKCLPPRCCSCCYRPLLSFGSRTS